MSSIRDMGSVKTFLFHKDPAKLTGLMLANNIKTSCYHDYRIVFADGLWYAWFEVDLNDILSGKAAHDVRGDKG